MTVDETDFERPGDASTAGVALDAVRPEGTVSSVEPLGRGNRKRTSLVRFADGGRVVLQFADDAARLRSEATLLAAVDERTAVPVPAVLASGVADGTPYLCTAHVAGADLHERFAGFDRPRQRELARTFGHHLGELHATFAFEGCGVLTVGDDRSDPGAADGSLAVTEGTAWPDWLAAYGRRAVDRLPAEFDDLRADLLALVTDPDVDSAPPARLYPWDFRPGNALVADGELAAVLDWESPLAAAPALSAAKAEYLVADWYVADPEPLRTAVREGYELVREYPSVRPVHRAAAVADSAVDSRGVVTNPRYPELDREGSVAFHRRALESTV